MKLVSYAYRGRVSIGKLVGAQVIDLPSSDRQLPATMLELLQGGAALMDRARAVASETAVTVPLADVRLLAPVPNPSKFLAIGMNYAKHVKESIDLGFKMPEAQVWFNKQVSCINGPFDPVHIPFVSEQLDYEVELCVVIGKRCRHVKAEDARSVIAGYMVTNDFTVRDWQLRSPTMTIGKSFNTTGPIGPWLVTDDEIADPHALPMRLIVNGEVRQQDTTGSMVANAFQQIEHLSAAFTLEPGDLIATGTPSGVAIAMKPPVWLKVGDVVRAEIDQLGFIENRIVAEPT
ncbi:fumarylacetoacetate hydrolase family protein [Variovorax sp. J22P271]|uniref:fumarylacetoacetate hydrolase family protein n=1 Tax=Variovorax davisae TaxID=3053515 RepID=UPI00257914C4|nr:fumarylacetoacetate hydrolase family protein [Variovorax sp. J22P271]MDM0032404.1 fumarylacetoacetate hydrolase family protein [Variovorax sp. J22P271]